MASTVYAILNCGVCTGNDAEHDKHQLIINDGKFSGKIRKGNDNVGFITISFHRIIMAATLPPTRRLSLQATTLPDQ